MHYGKLLALAGLVGIVSAEAGGSAYFYRRTMMRYNAKTERTMKMSGVDWEQYFSKMKECREWMMEQPHEDVWIRSEDSLKLHGTYFRGSGNVEEKKCKKAVICFHGYTSQGLADYGSISNYYLKRGYNVLLVDQRSHGQSEGKYIGSGTTGKSKGVMLTHRNLVENATCLDMKLPERNVILSVLPIHHAYCLSMDILKGISLGAIICINDSLMRVAKNIKLFKPNMILMVPLMIETFAKKLEDVKDLPEKVVKEAVFGSQFHTICSGGAYLNPEYIELFERFGIQILQGYGMTECSPVISTTVAWNVKKNSVGQLLPNCEAKTVDGELWVRGSSVMQGYYKMPEETKTALKDGWLCTGDLGYVDEERFIYLTGRKKNLIITKNGENVSPEELENKLSSSRLVQEVLVLSLIHI